MATPASLRTQLQSASSFLSAQQGALAPIDIAHHMDAMARSLLSQITGMSMDYSEATDLTQLVRDSTFADDIKHRIITALAEQALRGVAQRGVLRRSTQSLLYPLNYMTRSDWQVFNDRNQTQAQLVAIMGARLKKLRVSNPTEATIRNASAVLACMLWPEVDPQPQATLALATDLKQWIKLAGALDGVRLETYPPDPTILPRPLFTAAYEDEAPVRVTLSRYLEMTRRIVMRTSHSSVAGRRGENTNAVQALMDLIGLQSPRPSPSPSFLTLTRSPPSSTSIPHLQSLQIPDAQPASLPSTGGVPALLDLPRASPRVDTRRRISRKQPASVVETQFASVANNAPTLEAIEGMARSIYAGKKGAQDKKNGKAATEAKETSAKKTAKTKPKKTTQVKTAPKVKIEKASAATQPMKKFKGDRPSPPPSRMGTTVLYRGGKVNVSLLKGGYRVFKDKGDRVDKLVRWANLSSRKAAWAAALDIIGE